MMTKRDYKDEVRRLAGLLWSTFLSQGREIDVYGIMSFVSAQSPWIRDERFHEKLLEYAEYQRYLNKYDHDQIAAEMKSGDDWKVMRMLTATRVLALAVFDELQGSEMTPKKRWEPE